MSSAPVDPKLRVWESLRNDARHADSAIERQLNLLENISRFGDNTTGNDYRTTAAAADTTASSVAKIEAAQRDFDRQRAEVEESLRRFESLLETMAEASQALPDASAAQRHTERFAWLAAEKRRAVARLTADFRRRREWAELLPAVATDIEAHEEGGGVRFLMDEQDSLRHTQRRVNAILDQAETARERMRGQREAFTRIEDRVVQIALQVPLIKKVLGRIDSRRRKDVILVGGVIGVCMLLIVFFW